MDNEAKEQWTKEFEKEYFFVRRTKWWAFLGGAGAFIIAVGYVSYTAALQAVGSEAGKQAIARIEALRTEAEVKTAAVKSLADQADGLLGQVRKHAGDAQQVVNTAKVAATSLPTAVADLRTDLTKSKQVVELLQKPLTITPGPDSSPKQGGAGATLVRSECPEGSVVTGLEISLGGTCRNTCDLDGRPVYFFRVKCGRRA